MRILLTGQVGLDKSSYLNGARDLCAQDGVRLQSVSIGGLMLQGAAGTHTEATILNAPKNELKALRANAWAQALAEANAADPSDVFVANSHAVLRWNHGPIPALELDTLLQFGPGMVVTLIDDVDLVKKGLAERNTDIFQLWELMAWREEEIHIARLVGESLSRLTGRVIPFYLLPKQQGPELFARLVTRGSSKKAYLSFPVTGLTPDEKDEVDGFKREVSSGLVCFDPLALSERSIVTTAESLAEEIGGAIGPGLREVLKGVPSNDDRAWTPFTDERTALGLALLHTNEQWLVGQEVMSIMAAIDSQIIARDYLLIEQSDMIVAFIPVDEKGKPRISAGSISEMNYAYHTGKRVYIVFPGDRRNLSPWVTEFATARIFARVDECLDELRRL